VGEDPELFFNELANVKYKPILHSTSLLLPLLICSVCPLRSAGLEVSLRAPAFPASEDDYDVQHQRVFGVWGAATECNRGEVAGLPLAGAVRVLRRRSSNGSLPASRHSAHRSQCGR
jgi:hypothetical protein